MKSLLILVTLLALPLRAEDATSILARSDVFRNALDSFSIDIDLTSFEGTRSESSKFRVYGKGSDRSVVEFIAPATEKGKFMLMLRDAMWIYMPSASRPIRISPLQRLMGQASNGDVARTSFTVDYDATSASEDGDSWVVELSAKDPSIAYRRVRLWIDRASYEPRRAEFYVASGKLLKRAHYRKFDTMAGRRVVTEVEIEDLLRKGNRTVMRYANLTARANADKMFSKDALGEVVMIGIMIMAATLRFFGSAGAEAQLTPASHESPLNPGNVAAIPYRTNIGDATAFIEASTDDKRWKLRAKLRAEASDQTVDRGEVGEAFVQFAATDWLDVTAGRVIEKWGTGYGWTPTAFVGPAKNPTDPGDRRSAYRGRDMVRADVFVKDTNVSLYALEGGVVAARVYRLIRGTDVSLVYRRENGTNDAGISLSRVFGDALEVHAEVGRTAHTRAVVGAQYTFAGNTNVVFEVYHGTDGLTSRQWQSFRDSIADDLRGANAAYAPLRMARTYAFTRVSRPFGKADLELIAITSTRDRSTLLRAAATYKIHPNISLYAIDTELLGAPRSELAYLQVERITALGMRVYF